MTLMSEMREIDRRESDGLCVELLYHQERHEVWLHVIDHKAGDTEFRCRVPDSEALRAFHHPFLYEPIAR